MGWVFQKKNYHIFLTGFIELINLNRQSGGSGLGLSIVKYLIESHNGTIKINSELSKGTEVLISIKKFDTNL